MRVSDAIGDWFAARGIQHYFGYSGAAVLPLLDGLVGHPEIQGIQPKHESHAVHMADTYYRITGQIGSCCCHERSGHSRTASAVSQRLNTTRRL